MIACADEKGSELLCFRLRRRLRQKGTWSASSPAFSKTSSIDRALRQPCSLSTSQLFQRLLSQLMLLFLFHRGCHCCAVSSLRRPRFHVFVFRRADQLLGNDSTLKLAFVFPKAFTAHIHTHISIGPRVQLRKAAATTTTTSSSCSSST